MDTPAARAAPKFHLLFLLLHLSILLVIVCSSGVFFSLAKDIEQHQHHQQRRLQTEDQIFLSSRRKLLTKTTIHNLLNFLTSNSPGLVTVPPTTAVTSPMTPPTNPVTTPDTSDSVLSPNPTTPTGQSWCVAKNGLPTTSLQGALDYACGSGAYCVAIQQGGNCYYPDTVRDHASYAFNSYYQNHPNKTSCDFGGAAVLTNVNPKQWYLHLSILLLLYDITANNSDSSSNNNAIPYDCTSNNDEANSENNTILYNGTSNNDNDSNSNNDDSKYNNSGFLWSTPPNILNGNNSGLGGSTTAFGGIPPTTSPSPISMSSNLHQGFIGSIIVVTSFITRVT
ncbi:hypothetical protein OROGR_031239 [Orobanche gracilis]